MELLVLPAALALVALGAAQNPLTPYRPEFASLGYPPRQCFNWRSPTWCRKQIDRIYTEYIKAGDLHYPGNACVHNERMKTIYCCTMCQQLLGGLRQSQKDASFMQTAEPCAEAAADADYCRRRRLAGECGVPEIKVTCPVTCQYCTPYTQPFSTITPCESGSRCLNSSFCDAPSYPAAGNARRYCVLDGATASSSRLQGRCENCTLCARDGETCTDELDCGGADNHCLPHPTEGKCWCGACTLDGPCTHDVDCGGYAGSCMKPRYDAATGALTDYQSCMADDSADDCTCKYCPGKPCYQGNGKVECTFANAETVCGSRFFCLSSQTAPCLATDKANTCHCYCNLAYSVGYPEGFTTSNQENVAVCITGAPCTKGDKKCGWDYGVNADGSKNDSLCSAAGKCQCDGITAPRDQFPTNCVPDQQCVLPASDEVQGAYAAAYTTVTCSDKSAIYTAAVTTPGGDPRGPVLASSCRPDTANKVCQCGVTNPKGSAMFMARCRQGAGSPYACDASTYCGMINYVVDSAGAACGTCPPYLYTMCNQPTGFLGDPAASNQACYCLLPDMLEGTRMPPVSNATYTLQPCYAGSPGVCGYGKCVDSTDLKTDCTSSVYPLDAAGNAVVGTPACVCINTQCALDSRCALGDPTGCGGENVCKGDCVCQ